MSTLAIVVHFPRSQQRIYVHDDEGEFKEQEHPRDPNGEFRHGGGSSAATGEGTSTGKSEKQTNGPISHDPYTDEDKHALDEYQNGDYVAINDKLRKGSGSDAPLVRELDAAISRGSLQKPTTLYRGLAGGRPFSYKVGEVVSDPAYMSTSAKESVANDFSEGVGEDYSVMMKIKAPAGQSAAYFKEYEGFDHQEVLLPRGVKMRVAKVINQGGHKVVEMEIVGDELAQRQVPSPAPPSPSPARSSAAPAGGGDLVKSLVAKYHGRQLSVLEREQLEKDQSKAAKKMGLGISQLRTLYHEAARNVGSK